MPLSRLKLKVEWPGGRDVPVELLILPDLARGALREDAPGEKAGPPTAEIGSDDTASLAALQKFFADLTRSAAAGELRRASCLELRKEEVLELLEIEGPPREPIPIPLPADG